MCQLTFPQRLLVLEGERHHEESDLGHALPLLQHPHRPGTGPQGALQRRLVLRVLGVHVHRDLVGRGHHQRGVDPHDGGREVGPAGPLLHRQRLAQRPDDAAKVAEDPLLGVPLGADLPGDSDHRHQTGDIFGGANRLKFTENDKIDLQETFVMLICQLV